MMQTDATPSPSTFSLEGVSFSYRKDRPILREVSFNLYKGEFLGVLGPNGVGKSTLLSLMTDWRRPITGSINFLGKPLEKWDRRHFAREVAVVPQREEGLFPFTAEEVVMMGRYAHRDSIVGAPEEDRVIARAALRHVDLADYTEARLDELSGGERQRVLIARALSQCPKVILLDEPTASLDPSHQRTVFALMQRLCTEHGLTVMAISHDVNLAALYCKRFLLMSEGRLIADGTAEEIIVPEVLQRAYSAPLISVKRPDGKPMVGLQP